MVQENGFGHSVALVDLVRFFKPCHGRGAGRYITGGTSLTEEEVYAFHWHCVTLSTAIERTLVKSKDQAQHISRILAMIFYLHP